MIADLLEDAGQSALASVARRKGLGWAMQHRQRLIAVVPQLEQLLQTGDVDVVIPCHNQAQYLPEALASLQASTLQPSQVIVIDDASDVPVDSANLRVSNRNVHRTRGDGFERVTAKYCLFLDADNRVRPDYLRHAVDVMEGNPSVAGVFPVLQRFGDSVGVAHDTDRAPDVVTEFNLAQRNWCDAGTVWRTDALKQAGVFSAKPGSRCADWYVAQRVLRSGPWVCKKSAIPLDYRVHPSQLNRSKSTYFDDASLQLENVTIVIAFSGRWNIWKESLLPWIRSQTWPANQTRLLIMDSSHERPTVATFGLDDYRGTVQAERIDVGRKHLADASRRSSAQVRKDVETAVSAIYNRAVQLCPDEFVLFVEDDVVPPRDAVSRLLRSISWDVFGVSGAYRHAYETDSMVAFNRVFSDGKVSLLPISEHRVRPVIGTGFGCLLARRSVLQDFPLTGDASPCPHYDVDLGMRLRGKYRWLLDASVRCDHLTSGRH